MSSIGNVHSGGVQRSVPPLAAIHVEVAVSYAGSPVPCHVSSVVTTPGSDLDGTSSVSPGRAKDDSREWVLYLTGRSEEIPA